MLALVASSVGAVVVGLAAFEAIAERRAARRYPPPGKFIDVGGHRLHARIEGVGRPAVVFMSGAGSTSAAWALVQREIAKITTTCSYDRAGLAWSDTASSSRTLAQGAVELRMLLQQAELDPPFVLVPHSLSGAIAMQFASDHPHDVAGIVFVDAAYAELYETYLERFPSWRGRIARGKALLLLAEVAARLGVPRIARINIAHSKLPPDERASANALGRAPKFFRAMRAEISGLVASADDARPSPPAGIPAIVLSHGDPKALFREEAPERLWHEMQEQLAQRFVDAEVRVVKGAGHFIQLDRPDAVVAAIQDVLGAVRI